MNGDICGTRSGCGDTDGGGFAAFGNDPLVDLADLQTAPNGTDAFGINSHHQIVGWMQFSGNGDRRRAFLKNQDVFTVLGTLPGGNFSEAYAINEAGVVCGLSTNTVTGPLRAFIWSGEMMAGLELPLGPNSVAYDIADDGSVCGWMGKSPFIDGHAFVHSRGKVRDLDTVLPNAIGAEARGISNDGAVCGYAIYPDADPTIVFRRRAFLWDKGTAHDLGVLPGYFSSFAYKVNDDREVVGFCEALPGTSLPLRAFVWRNGQMRALNDLIPPSPQLDVRSALDINNAGQIAATARMFSGTGQVLGTFAIRLDPIPSVQGDVNCDRAVNIDDLVGVITRWDDQGGPADLDASGTVGIGDLMLVLTNWNQQ